MAVKLVKKSLKSTIKWWKNINLTDSQRGTTNGWFWDSNKRDSQSARWPHL